MFSVILPVYNGERYIDDAVESALKQRERDWELIIINDGSTDGTGRALEKYKSLPRIKIIAQKNLGVSAARNRGIAASSGDYIAFLDADDVWSEDHLEVMRDMIKKYPDAGLYGSFTRTELVNGDTIEECNFFKDREETVRLDNFFEEYYKDSSAKMFTVITSCVSRQAFDKVGGFRVGCKIGEDLELFLKIAAYFPVVLTSRATATYRRSNSSATKNVSFDPDWGFFYGAAELYADKEVPEYRKESLKKLMRWFTMRRCRHYIIDGNKKKAFEHFSEIGSDPKLRKDKLITFVLMCMPIALVRKIFEIRWRGQA